MGSVCTRLRGGRLPKRVMVTRVCGSVACVGPEFTFQHIHRQTSPTTRRWAEMCSRERESVYQAQWCDTAHRSPTPPSLGESASKSTGHLVKPPSKAQGSATTSLFTLWPLPRAKWPGDDHMGNPPRPVSSKKARCSKLSFLPSSKANYFGAIDLSKRQQRKQLHHKVAAAVHSSPVAWPQPSIRVLGNAVNQGVKI